MVTTITARELHLGDVVSIEGDSYTVKTADFGPFHGTVIWVGVNDEQPYTYDGTESWPLVSRTLDGELSAIPGTIEKLQHLARHWAKQADEIRPEVDETFGYDSSDERESDLVADIYDEVSAAILAITGQA